MTEPHREPRSDLVSFGPTVDDTRAFTVGLWATETLLFALLLAGLTVLRGLGDTVNVLVAVAGIVWFAAVTAVVLRGRLQQVPGPGRRILAIVAALAFAAWLVIFIMSASAGNLSFRAQLVFDIVGVFLESAALVSAYFARMFRWRSDSGRG